MPRLPLVLALISSTLIGCGVPQRKAKILKIEPSQLSVVTYPTELRAAYLKDPNAPLRYCAEPVPDIALQSLTTLAATVKASQASQTEAEGTFNSEFSTTAVELAGRSQLLLIAREMLYRACEISANRDPNAKDTADKLYAQVIDLLRDLGDAEKSNAEAAKENAIAKKSQANAARAKALHDAGATIDQILKSEPRK